MEPAPSTSEEYKIKKNQFNFLTFSSETVFILSCILAAFLIRFSLIPQQSVINGDGIYYAGLGKKLISGDFNGGLSAYWSPLYPFFVGISSLFFEDLEFAGRFVSVAAGTLLVVPAYFLIRDFYGRAAAYLGTILIVIHPLLIASSGWVMTESLYTLIFTTGVLIGWRALRRHRRRDFFTTGLLFGAAYLTKPEAIGFIGLFFVLTVGAKFFRSKTPFRRLAIGYTFLLLGFSIFSLPYVGYLYQKTGHWTISQKITSNVSAIDSDKALLELTDDGQTTMRDRLFGDVYETENQAATNSSSPASADKPRTTRFSFSGLLTKTFNQLTKQVREHLRIILPVPFILLAFIGFFFRRWTKRRVAKEIYLFSFVSATFIGYALTVIELRYLFPIIPLLLCWTARGTVEFSNWLAKFVSGFLKIRQQVNPILIQGFTLFVLIISLVPSFLYQFKADELENVPFSTLR